MVIQSESSFGTETVHPTFFYESVWNLLGFLIITFFVYRAKKFDGQIILSYLAWYGFGRFFIEGLRTDSLYLGNTGIRISQLLALLTFLFAVAAMIIIPVLKKKNAESEKEYTNQFDTTNAESTESQDQTITTDEKNTDTDSVTEDN